MARVALLVPVIMLEELALEAYQELTQSPIFCLHSPVDRRNHYHRHPTSLHIEESALPALL